MDARANFGYSVVAGAPSPATSGTSLTVSAGHGSRFPTPPFNAVVWPADTIPTPANAEIVRVTSIVTDTLTIDREEESTTARTIIVGDQIAAAITKKTLDDIATALATIVTDHGALSGLGDDDHTQYLKKRGSGGAEADVPGHDHTATAKGGTLSFYNDIEVVQLTSASDNWTPPSGTVGVLAEIQGAGGGGGGADNDGSIAGGGGAGEYVRHYFTAAEIGASAAYSCGAVGSAGSNTGGTGGTGGDTTFKGITAAGGSGGEGATTLVPGKGGLGGTGGTGTADLRRPGWAGFAGAAANTGAGSGGKGADSPFGAGGRGGYDDEAGSNALGYGAGGGGAVEDDTTGQTGGTGSAGCIVLTVYKRV